MPEPAATARGPAGVPVGPIDGLDAPVEAAIAIEPEPEPLITESESEPDVGKIGGPATDPHPPGPPSGDRSARPIIVAAAVTFVVVLNHHLNHFYTAGAYFADSGWFAHLASHSVPPMMDNPAPIPGEFFGTHFSPIFWIYTAISRTILFPFDEATRFSIYQAGWAAAMTVGLTLGARRLLRPWLAAATGLILTFNGIVIAVLAFPHIELAIPAAMILFLGLRATPSAPSIAAWAALVLGLLVREDAGLHYFGLLASAAVLMALTGMRDRARGLVVPALACLVYGAAMVAVQKLIIDDGTGPNLLQALYLGDPAYAHLNSGLLFDRIGFLFREKLFLVGPAVVLGLALVATRSWLALAGGLSVVPWALFNLTALAPHVGAFETYYSFPLVLYLVWPLFALIETGGGSEVEADRGASVWGQPTRWLVPLLVVLSLGSLALTAQPVALDGKRHPIGQADLAYVGDRSAVNEAVGQLRDERSLLGDYLADDALATLLVADLEAENWIYRAHLNGVAASERGQSIDVVLYWLGGDQHGQFEVFADAVGLSHRYRFPDTPIGLAARQPRQDLMDAWNLETP